MTDQQAEHEIRQRETHRFEAIVRGDVAALEDILSDDLSYTHATGVFETKGEFIAKLKSGQLKYESFAPEGLRVRVYGTTGVLTGVARVKVQVKGEQLSFQLRFTDVYVKKGDRWQMVAWHATRLS
ncbi:MAG TPA: nuclear transport factor 2 family protein [Candidatus Methylomirabilis sp.]|nr:nuclear transport factor 2 family protein [Candidatus Methylomirabilis sp.]